MTLDRDIRFTREGIEATIKAVRGRQNDLDRRIKQAAANRAKGITVQEGTDAGNRRELAALAQVHSDLMAAREQLARRIDAARIIRTMEDAGVSLGDPDPAELTEAERDDEHVQAFPVHEGRASEWYYVADSAEEARAAYAAGEDVSGPQCQCCGSSNGYRLGLSHYVGPGAMELSVFCKECNEQYPIEPLRASDVIFPC